MTNDAHLRQEVATVIRDHPIAATLQIEERVTPARGRKLPRRGWVGDAQTEADINMAMSARRVAWNRQKADTQDSQLKRVVWQENRRIHRVCDAAYERFLGRYIQDPE